jgi:hypothetical protein
MKIVSISLPLTLLIALLAGCASGPDLLPPEALQSPTPIPDSSGEYVAPYTSDGVVAGWVEKAVNAKMGAAVGGTVGAFAGQQALKQVPFVGGILGQQAGQAMGRKIAVESSGGWEFIRESSDLSFTNASDLSVWLYVNYSTNEHYRAVLSATQEIYPELKETYHTHLMNASRVARAQGVAPAMGDPEQQEPSPVDRRVTL